MAKKKTDLPTSLTLAIDIVFTLLAGLFVISNFEKVEALILKKSEVSDQMASVGQSAARPDSVAIVVEQTATQGKISLQRHDQNGQVQSPVRQILFNEAEMDRAQFTQVRDWVEQLEEGQRLSLRLGPGVRWGVVAQLQDLCTLRRLRPVWTMAD